MKIRIDIECETIDELRGHLREMNRQVGKKARCLRLDPDQEFPEGIEITDSNCYGLHEFTVLKEDL